MTNRAILSFMVILLVALHPVAMSVAQEQPTTEPIYMDDDGLKIAFSGQTHIGFYRDYLERYGSIQFEETYFTDGTLAYAGGGLNVKGTWEIIKARICFEYEDPQFLPGCFAVTTNEGCYYSHESTHPDDESQGLASQWWIFSHIKGEKVTCTEAALLS